MKAVKKYLGILKDAFNAFIDDNAVKLSAALSYYTIFSIGPMLIIAMSLAGVFYGQEAVQGKLFGQLRGLLGTDAAAQVQSIIQNIQQSENSTMGTIIGGIILLIGATGIFVEIQDSINYIWSLKAKPKRGIVKLLINRLVSFSLIISVGFLLLVSLLINTAMDVLNEKLFRMFPDTTIVLFYILNILILIVVISVLFAIIFKVLPDGKIKWKDAFVGAVFTAVLFILGKTGIGFYLGNSTLGATYGTAAAVVIILTWVYYTSIILYFGAEFTKVYALDYGGGIVPHKTAVFIIKQEAKEIQTKHKHPQETEESAKERDNRKTE